MTESSRISASQWIVAAHWFERANGDLRIARTIVDRHPDTIWGAAMHCQQTLEKLAKGLLIAYGSRPPRSHDIEALADLVEIHDPALGVRIGALGELTAWYFGARYPNGAGESLPTVSEVEITIGHLEGLCRDIERLAPKTAE